MIRRLPAFSAVLGTVAGILILASGCADQGPTDVQLRPARTLSAAKAYQGGSFALNISPAGGTITFPIGKIVFPAGAVSEPTTINARVDGKTLAVNFEPHIVFPDTARPVLTLSLAGIKVSPSRLFFVHVIDDGTVATTMRPTFENGNASIDVDGFSRWAIISE